MTAAAPGTDYDFWLFDLDGTVVDAEWRYKRELLDRVGDAVGHDFTDAEVETLWDGIGGDRDELLARWGLAPTAFWEIFDGLDDPTERAAATRLYDDARWIGAIDRPVGIVTHCPEPITRMVLDELDVADWFDAVVACDESVGWKPDPAPVERAVDGLDGVTGRSGSVSRRSPGDRHGILVGDGAADVGAAWNAGLHGAHVERHDPVRRGHCVLGDLRVESLTELRGRTGAPAAADD